MPTSRLTTVHECTGNGRSFFGSQQGTPAAGTQWTLGAVGAVAWEGVRLSTVLRRIGLDPHAVSVMATGLDADYVTGGVDYGPVRRPFPIGKALDDALVVWGADGHDLLPDHGYPIRLILPGWVGIASIKWLGSLEVSTTEQTSPWNTKWYRMTGGSYPPDSPPLTVNPVRSAFELAWGASLVRRRLLPLTGRSWSGAGPDRPGRRQHRRRHHLGPRTPAPRLPSGGLDAVGVRVASSGARRPRRHGPRDRRRGTAAAARDAVQRRWLLLRRRRPAPGHRGVSASPLRWLRRVALRPSRNRVTVPDAPGTGHLVSTRRHGFAGSAVGSLDRESLVRELVLARGRPLDRESLDRELVPRSRSASPPPERGGDDQVEHDQGGALEPVRLPVEGDERPEDDREHQDHDEQR